MKSVLSRPNFLFLLTIPIALNSFCQEGWIDQTPDTPYPGLYGVYAIDPENIWAVGEGGLILHSSDGGESWDSIPSGTTETLYTVEFLNADTGWVAGDDDYSASTVLRTVDGGETWEPQSLAGGGAIPIYDVDFTQGGQDGSVGYITGGLGFTWNTEDFGGYWGPVRNDCENTFFSCWFVNRDTGWFVGTPSVAEPYTIMITTDGGETWQEQTNPAGQNLRGVSFGSDTRGVAGGLVGTLLYTSDGGTTWEESDDGGFTRWESVYMTPSGNAWASGANGAIAHSTDWGQTWTMQESGMPTGLELWEVYFLDDLEGWVVGGGIGHPGVILHTTNGGVSSGTGTSTGIATEGFRLDQNYPNPFLSSTRIAYSIPEDANVRILLYNVLGERIGILQDQFRSAGNHHIEVSGESLSPGVYYYSIEAGEHSDIKKMMLLK